MGKIEIVKKEMDDLTKNVETLRQEIQSIIKQIEKNPGDNKLREELSQALKDREDLKAEIEEVKVKLLEIKEDKKPKEPEPEIEPKSKEEKDPGWFL
jgi:uncharacterized coiled-coil DUF342 family protein